MTSTKVVEHAADVHHVRWDSEEQRRGNEVLLQHVAREIRHVDRCQYHNAHDVRLSQSSM
jgi:hypothetical protein